MSIVGVAYAINGLAVTPPDEEVWTDITLGITLTGLQSRSPYKRLEWRKQVAGACDLDWYDYDNTILTSLTTRIPGHLGKIETFTDVVCQSVSLRQRLGVASEIVATFIVYIG